MPNPKEERRGDLGVSSVDRIYSERGKDPEIVDAIALAIEEHSCAQWPCGAKDDVHNDMYEKLFDIRDRHPDWKVRAVDAVSEIQLQIAPDRLEKGLDVDIFSALKKSLLINYPQLRRSSMTLIFRIFEESLTILSTGKTLAKIEAKKNVDMAANKYTVSSAIPVKLLNPADRAHFQ